MNNNMTFFYIMLRSLVYRLLYSIDQLTNRKTLITVFCYHSIADSGWKFSVTKQNFLNQIAYLNSQATAVKLSDLADYLTGQKQITKPVFIITFDDGYQDIQSVQPELIKLKISPTVFALSNPSKADRTTMQTNLPLLTTTQLKKLINNGWEIGSHGQTHQILTTCTQSDLKAEITVSKQTLEKNLGSAIKYIAYPLGRYNQQTEIAVKQAGYTLGLTMDDQPISRTTNRYTISRVGVDGSHTFTEFKTLNSPSVIWFRSLIKKSPLGKYF